MMGTWLESQNVFPLSKMLPVGQGRKLVFKCRDHDFQSNFWIVQSKMISSILFCVRIDKNGGFSSATVALQYIRARPEIVVIIKYLPVRLAVSGYPFSLPQYFGALINQRPYKIRMVKVHMGRGSVSYNPCRVID